MSASVTVVLQTSDDMVEAGRIVGARLRAGDVLVLTGPLGAGKTTFARGLGDALGVRGPVTSPTFVLARTHPSLVGGAELVHVDAYRLGSPAELDDLGLDLASSVTVVEWGRDAVPLIVGAWIELTIERSMATSAELEVDLAAGGTESADAGDQEPLDPRAFTLTREGDFDEVRAAAIASDLIARFA